MALLPILQYPDPRLNTVAKPVEQFDAELKQLAADMAETMYAAPGVGLAATQVNRHIRLLVADVSETHDQLQVFINPVIVAADGTAVREEGCLSVPGIYEKVKRAEQVRVRFFGLDGQRREMEADGLLAVCIQHEIDHLDGKVFVEYLSSLKQDRIRKKLKKHQRETL